MRRKQLAVGLLILWIAAAGAGAAECDYYYGPITAGSVTPAGVAIDFPKLTSNGNRSWYSFQPVSVDGPVESAELHLYTLVP
ncbi:MAG TPA: hypothetical protein VK633_09935, partial [Verrucomicrobiae bacterium]|nr:hypothetical protein [Verrucomicrobiae bacterium]